MVFPSSCWSSLLATSVLLLWVIGAKESVVGFLLSARRNRVRCSNKSLVEHFNTRNHRGSEGTPATQVGDSWFGAAQNKQAGKVINDQNSAENTIAGNIGDEGVFALIYNNGEENATATDEARMAERSKERVKTVQAIREMYFEYQQEIAKIEGKEKALANEKLNLRMSHMCFEKYVRTGSLRFTFSEEYASADYIENFDEVKEWAETMTTDKMNAALSNYGLIVKRPAVVYPALFATVKLDLELACSEET